MAAGQDPNLRPPGHEPHQGTGPGEGRAGPSRPAEQVAAQFDAPFAPARLLTAYVADPAAAAAALDLRPTDSGANVVLAANTDDFAFDRARDVDDLRVAAVSQVAVDLMTGPGRNPSEADALLDWMEENEDAWRR